MITFCPTTLRISKSRTLLRALMAFVLVLATGTAVPAEQLVEPDKQTMSNEPGSITIAMAQIFCLDGDRSGNLLRIENAIREAVAQGAEIVCFPETCILGWTNADAHQRAFPIPGDDSQALSRLAREHGVFLCVGLAEKAGDALYDSVVLIDDQGKILLKHRKINILTELMNPPYTKGTEVRTVATRFGQIGLLICADTFDEPTLDRMTKAGPDLVLVPYGWANREEAWPEHGQALQATVSSAARRFRCPVVGTDAVGQISKGPWAGMVYGGQSVAVDKEGNVIARAADRDREVKIFQLQIGN